MVEGDTWLPRDPQRAAQLFRDALTLDPTNAAANFGLGVTLLQQEAYSNAVPYLCAAHRTAVGALRRDVEELLDKRAIDCP
ncbi:MAG: tetratricopeptide repeat protein [Myxococcota bacterium]